MPRFEVLASNLKFVVPNAEAAAFAGWNGRAFCNSDSTQCLGTILGNAEVAGPSSYYVDVTITTRKFTISRRIWQLVLAHPSGVG